MTRKELTDQQIEERFLKGKPGRKAGTAATPVESGASDQAIAQIVVAADSMAATHDAMDEAFASGVDIGRLEALDFVATVATSALISVYENVKKSKAWRHLRNPKSGDGRHFESLDDFCEVKLGRSYRRFRELAANRVLIGQAAFDQAERIGLRQVDYNALKALPAPDQELVRRAVEEAQSRDEVLDLLQELAARHAKEKEQLTTQVEEAKATLEAKDRVLADKNERLTKLEEEGKRKFKPSAGSEAKTAQEQALLTELDQASSAAYLAIHKTFAAADVALSDSGAREAIQTRARQAVEFLVQQLADMAEEFGIQVDLEARIAPPWLNEEALASLEARNAANPHTNPRAK